MRDLRRRPRADAGAWFDNDWAATVRQRMDVARERPIESVENVFGRREKVPGPSDVVQPVRRQLRSVRPRRDVGDEFGDRLDAVTDRARVVTQGTDCVHLVRRVALRASVGSEDGIGPLCQRSQIGPSGVRRGGRGDNLIGLNGESI